MHLGEKTIRLEDMLEHLKQRDAVESVRVERKTPTIVVHIRLDRRPVSPVADLQPDVLVDCEIGAVWLRSAADVEERSAETGREGGDMTVKIPAGEVKRIDQNAHGTGVKHLPRKVGADHVVGPSAGNRGIGRRPRRQPMLA